MLLRSYLVLSYKSTMLREAGWLDEGAPEILRGAQDDSRGFVILSTTEILHGAQDDSRGFVVLSTAKDLGRT
jgi:hypothetical protein